MEKLYFEIPSIERKNEAIEYISEHYEYKSDINGSGGLHRYLDNYEGWLDKLEKDYERKDFNGNAMDGIIICFCRLS